MAQGRSSKAIQIQKSNTQTFFWHRFAARNEERKNGNFEYYIEHKMCSIIEKSAGVSSMENHWMKSFKRVANVQNKNMLRLLWWEHQKLAQKCSVSISFISLVSSMCICSFQSINRWKYFDCNFSFRKFSTNWLLYYLTEPWFICSTPQQQPNFNSECATKWSINNAWIW